MTEADELTAVLRGRERPWPLMERVLTGLWRLSAPPAEATFEQTGAPASLRQFVEAEHGPLSVAMLQRRDPYTKPDGFAEQLAELASGGWIEALGGGEYRISERAHAKVREGLRAGDGYLQALDVMSPADLDGMAAILERLVAAGDAQMERPTRDSVEGDQAAGTPALGRIRALLTALTVQRGAAHSLAWGSLDVPGHAWNAFTLIRRGQARSAREVAAVQSWRGYDADEYAAAIADLVSRGWLEPEKTTGRFRVTPAPALSRRRSVRMPQLYESITYEKDAPIATITLNRPDKLNALSDGLQLEVRDALEDAGWEDDSIRVIVLKSAGRAFSAGSILAVTATTGPAPWVCATAH